MNILQNIFKDHFEEMLYILHPREAVIENVNKMISCGDPSSGSAMYGCSKCGNLKFVPFRCHSRFCPTCGNHYSMERTTSMSFKLIHCQHRHCVFTIPEELRPFFLEDRNLLNCLFRAVQSVVLRMFSKENKSENFVPGFICVLHTFSRSLHWNPHIHCLVSEGGAGNITPWRHLKHFNYSFLRTAFRTALLNEMEAHIGKSFKIIKSSIYKQCDDGFYVYAKPNKCNPMHVAKYIGRYLGRPVISTKRIDKYDGNFVTFHYNRHEDDKLIVETLPALDFIERLIQHIPEKNFKMIRYYGLYARHHKQDSKLKKAVSKEKHKLLRSLNEWRTSISISFGYDPLKCSCCGETMGILEIYYKKRTSLR
ncbi:MAG: transposase [Bacillaceae bacterium]|nr:transposase [Bacillaceae bacterium]